MAGSSSVTLFRGEDATIFLSFSARQAAKELVLDLSQGTLAVGIAAYPQQVALVTITGDSTVSGITLQRTFPKLGQATLSIPVEFWRSTTARRFRIDATFTSTVGLITKLGEQLIDLTE